MQDEGLWNAHGRGASRFGGMISGSQQIHTAYLKRVADVHPASLAAATAAAAFDRVRPGLDRPPHAVRRPY